MPVTVTYRVNWGDLWGWVCLCKIVVLCCAGSAASSPSSSASGGSSGAGSQVVADSALSCFVMKRADFERLLGPYEELWRYEALRKVRPTGTVCKTP